MATLNNKTATRLFHAESSRQPPGVERRMHLGVVIEVNENIAPRIGVAVFDLMRGHEFCIAWLFAVSPMFNTIGPFRYSFAAVTADIKLCRAVQANISEIGGEIFRVRPLFRRVGENKRDVLLTQ